MLGNNIITYRKKLGLSQQQLADRMNVVRQTISKWEKDLSVPDADALVRLADALDVTVPELLGQPVPENAGTPEYAAVLAQIAQEMATQNRRRSHIWKVVAWVLGIVLAITVALHVIGLVAGALYSFDPVTVKEVGGAAEYHEGEEDADALFVDLDSMTEVIGTEEPADDEADPVAE